MLSLFPTGLITELPSGVKRRSPLRYTVPRRLLNLKRTSPNSYKMK
jgi:hypothetical protein